MSKDNAIYISGEYQRINKLQMCMGIVIVRSTTLCYFCVVGSIFQYPIWYFFGAISGCGIEISKLRSHYDYSRMKFPYLIKIEGKGK